MRIGLPRFSFFILVILIATFSQSQTITYDLENDDEYGIINSIGVIGTIDDQIQMAQHPIKSCDINNNGQLDYVTAKHDVGKFFILLDQPDLNTSSVFVPGSGNSVVVNGAAHLGSDFSVGDFNGDGIDDVLIGAMSENGDGEAFVIYGTTNFIGNGSYDINNIADVRVSFSGFSGNPDLFGSQVNSADLNNDGFDDIIIGATVAWYEGDGSGRGSIYVKYGNSNLPSIVEATEDSDIIIEGDGSFDHIGKYLVTGDFNSDNFDDLVFTSPHWPGAGADGQRGKAWILFGSENMSAHYNVAESNNEITSFAGENQSDEMAFASVADFNGDGVDDLVLSAGKYDADISFPSSNNFGRVYINFGPISPGETYDSVEDYSSQTQLAPNPQDIDYSHTYMYIDSKFGQSVASRDINGDGFDDLLIGAPGYSRWPSTGSQTNEGGAFIILGRESMEEILYASSQYAVFLSVNDVSELPNLEFGRAVNYVSTNNGKTLAAVCDVMRSKIYLFDLQDIVAIDDENHIVESTNLLKNYPNPFNSSTTIKYSLQNRSKVQISIYNLKGELITKLVDKIQESGMYYAKWDAQNVSSGVYIINMETDEMFENYKCILIK